MIFLFCLKDKKANLFEKPFAVRSAAEAIRSITNVAQSKDSILSQFPSDFALYELGRLNQETGVISVPPEPVHYSEVADLVNPSEVSA